MVILNFLHFTVTVNMIYPNVEVLFNNILASMAADHFRQELLLSKEDEQNLKVKLDMANDEVDREGQIINFYMTPSPNIDWARPFLANYKVQSESECVLL